MVKIEKEKPQKGEISASGEARYPWGTQLSFDAATAKKLGLDTKKVTLGAVLDFDARVEVASISKESVTLQVVECAVESREDFSGAFKEAAEKGGSGK